jgi:PfaD family protein
MNSTSSRGLIKISNQSYEDNTRWCGNPTDIAVNIAEIKSELTTLAKPLWVVGDENEIGLTQKKSVEDGSIEKNIYAWAPGIQLPQLGDPQFCKTYGVKAAYYAGAMANALTSKEMVIALGKAGYLASFGAAGLPLSVIEETIKEIQSALPNGPFAFNLIHSPYEGDLEQKIIDLYLKYGINIVEASAFLRLSPAIVAYRASGLSRDNTGEIVIKNHVIAKISRKEVAIQFMEPAPERILANLVTEGRITAEQAELARLVPMADDITAEADSGGHTDNRPMAALMTAISELRDEVQDKYQYILPVRVGLGGGISTPDSALAAFMMGAAYIVTGTLNQACVESGACEHTKVLLATAEMTDVTMAPSADMFEMGVKVQVLKKGTLFPMRAQKLYDIYTTYDSIEAISNDERQNLEQKIFQRTLDSVWRETVEFFSKRDPKQIEKANNNPKRKMALIFRWYLGLASRWSRDGIEGREMDYQIWCGPSIGPFNNWTKNTYLENPKNRKVADVIEHLFTGAAYQFRVQILKSQGIHLPTQFSKYHPEKPLID